MSDLGQPLPNERIGFDRRRFLRRVAMAGGVAWATPVISSVGLSRAAATPAPCGVTAASVPSEELVATDTPPEPTPIVVTAEMAQPLLSVEQYEALAPRITTIDSQALSTMLGRLAPLGPGTVRVVVPTVDVLFVTDLLVKTSSGRERFVSLPPDGEATEIASASAELQPDGHNLEITSGESVTTQPLESADCIGCEFASAVGGAVAGAICGAFTGGFGLVVCAAGAAAGTVAANEFCEQQFCEPPNPEIKPASQTISAADAATYNVYVPQADSITYLRLDYGDGDNETKAVPAGSNISVLFFSHRFPDVTQTYGQLATIIESADRQGGSVTHVTATSVCPAPS